MAFQFMPGATAVGITFSEGVVPAAEKRVSYGNFVINKNTKKTFLVTDYVGAACAGMIADMQVPSQAGRSFGENKKTRNSTQRSA